jgi:hypothetical protein
MHLMKTATVANDLAAVWERIQFDGNLAPSAARSLLGVHFSPEDQKRMRQLSAKARAGTLTAAEDVEIDAYERFGCLLDILHSKARLALKKRRPAS